MEWYHFPLIPVFLVVHPIRKRAAERTTLNYLENSTQDSSLSDLSAALQQLLDDTHHFRIIYDFATPDPRGKIFWDEDCFTRYASAKLGRREALGRLTPLLWRIFCSAGLHPFPPSTRADEGVVSLGREAFERAIALLVLRGFELFGAKTDGRPFSRDCMETRYGDRIPRLARVIFESLRTSTESHNEVDSLRMADVLDTLRFTQPLTYGFYPYGPNVGEEHFQNAARRLLPRGDEVNSKTPSASPTVWRDDLQALVSLTLQLRLSDDRWRDGLHMPETFGFSTQRTGDVQHASLVVPDTSDDSTTRLTAAFARARFGGSDDRVSMEAFEAWCIECPTFILLYYQLWAAFFIPTAVSPSRRSGPLFSSPRLPTSIANILSLLNVAKFLTFTEGTNYRFHANELQLLQDLQNSHLVADTSTTSDVTSEEIYATLTARDRYHIILLQGRDLEPAGPDDGTDEQLLALFLSPSQPGMEMSHDLPKGLSISYVWRTTVVQLLPEVVEVQSEAAGECPAADGDGMHYQGGLSVYRGSGRGGLEFRAKQAEADGREVSVRLEVRKKVAQVEGLGRSAVLRMRLTRLRCYRLPAVAHRVTHHPSKYRPGYKPDSEDLV